MYLQIAAPFNCDIVVIDSRSGPGKLTRLEHCLRYFVSLHSYTIWTDFGLYQESPIVRCITQLWAALHTVWPSILEDPSYALASNHVQLETRYLEKFSPIIWLRLLMDKGISHCGAAKVSYEDLIEKSRDRCEKVMDEMIKDKELRMLDPSNSAPEKPIVL